MPHIARKLCVNYNRLRGRNMSELSKERLFGIGEEFAFCRQSLDEKFGAHENPSLFYFTSDSDAMNPIICKGDTLIVDRSLIPKSSNIVIVSFRGEFLRRRLKKKGSQLSLLSERGRPIHVTSNSDLDFFGVVTGLARKFL